VAEDSETKVTSGTKERKGSATCCTNARRAIMPKMKTKSGAAKRFRVRGSGSVKRYQAGKRHILTKRATKNKRQLRGSTGVHATNLGHVKAMLPYA
jgi:large subunit ribosomal protein L35